MEAVNHTLKRNAYIHLKKRKPMDLGKMSPELELPHGICFRANSFTPQNIIYI